MRKEIGKKYRGIDGRKYAGGGLFIEQYRIPQINRQHSQIYSHGGIVFGKMCNLAILMKGFWFIINFMIYISHLSYA